MEMSVRKKRGVQTWNQVMHFWSTALSIKSTPMVILAIFDKLEVVEATKSDWQPRRLKNYSSRVTDNLLLKVSRSESDDSKKKQSYSTLL